jgi:murE/murF fusion protein
VDDAAGRRIASGLKESFVGFSLSQPVSAVNLVARDILMDASGVCFTLVYGAISVELKSKLFGLHNVSNVLCVVSILLSMGWDLKKIAPALALLEPVDGRLQKVTSVQANSALPTVIVDYAHTPDALERALDALRPLASKQNGKLWCVFGCGGNRDAGKRPMMGAIALKYADQVVVTSDNPRDELPESIIAQIVDPLPEGVTHVVIESDRAQAILRTVLNAQTNDIVLIAGKGHETYQEVNGIQTAFDDRQWCRLALLLKDGLELQSDSRKIGPGAVFIALAGETFNGHDYLAQVQESGAIAAIVNQIDPTVSLSQIAVGDTRRGLLQIGKAWRKQFDIPVIAVTGSNGKTTTKEMIASILAAWVGESQRLATAGNLNNELGVPFTLLRMNAQHRAAVIELGMNHPGEIAVLADITAPTVALVNNAQREHQEFMVSVEAVAVENGQVLLSLPAGGVGVYPANDAYTTLWNGMSQRRERLHFGFTQQAQIWPSNIESDALGTSFLMHTPLGEHQVVLSVPGAHNLSNALAAAACGLAAGVPLESVAQGLSEFHAVSGRMQPHRLADGIVMIDDTYNANPDSVRAAIDVLASMSGPRVLVLGDMGEVGDNGPAMHYEVGEYAHQKGIEHLLTLGQATQESARAFGTGAVACLSIEHVREELAKIPAKSVLIKGSRFMRMERIAREYLERFSVVPKELVNHAV